MLIVREPADLPALTMQQPANSGALAVLADVAGNAREEMEVATQLKVSQHIPATYSWSQISCFTLLSTQRAEFRGGPQRACEKLMPGNALLRTGE